uniref:Suppressor of hairless protein n=1 Tax=Globodera rostochiensis TaxID=31243 RepID=A0A914GYA0_GLORO
MASMKMEESADFQHAQPALSNLFSPPLLLTTDQQRKSPPATIAQTYEMPPEFVPSGIGGNGITPEPTVENFFHFVHLANTFGFQFDLGQKLLRWNANAATLAALDTAQKQMPMEMDDDTETPPIASSDQCQKGPKQKRKEKELGNWKLDNCLLEQRMTEYGVVGSTVADHHLAGVFCAPPPNVENAVSQTDDKTANEPVLASSSSSSSVQQQPQAPQSRAHQSQAVHHHQQHDHSVPHLHPPGVTACLEDVQLDIANHFPPWLAAVADAEQQQLQQQQFMHFPAPFPTMMMPFDYGTLVPPPPPPMAYPTPHGQAVYDEQHQQHQHQLFGGLYDSLAAALAAGGGQFGPLMHPASSSASFGGGPSGSNINHNIENNDFYAYQHQLNIALSQYPPPPASSTATMAPYPAEYSHRSAEQQPPLPPHHLAYGGAGNNFELYMQHNHPPPMFIYPSPNDGCPQQHEFGGGGTTTTSASYAAEHEHQQQEWKHLAAAMTASASAGRRVAANPTGGGGGCSRGGQKRGADGRPPKISNTPSSAVGSGHLTVPSTSRRSSSASTKAHLSSATVSPIHSHSNEPPAEYTAQQHHILPSAQIRQFFPLLAQLPPPQLLTTAIVREYLANPSRHDCVLWIYHAKVAQKSYGTEKRFFCPPPCIYLVGEGWKTRRKLLDQLYRQHKAGFKSSPSASGGGAASDELLFGGGSEGRELFTDLSVSIVVGGVEGADKQHPQHNHHHKQQQQQHQQQQPIGPIHHQLDFSNGKDYSAAKALFISDSDKRKYFHLHVISKPSKKKQSMKSSDCKYLCVGNRSKIALFNRLRSQTVSTRYLHVDGPIPATNSTPQRPPVFVASSTKWGAFHINVVEPADYTGQQPQHSVTYGSVIQLVDSQTEMRLPLMRIRKGEPVSQLHKCAFQMVDGTSNGAELFYLCLSHDKIIQHQAKIC